MLSSLTLLLLPAAAQGGPFLVDTGVGIGLFEVDNPAASESEALRLNDDLMEKDGRVPAPTAGWGLTSRVIVRTNDLRGLSSLAHELAPGSTVTPLEGAAGFWLVDAGTVEAGIALCTDLDPWFGDDEVYLDTRRPLATRLPNDPMLSQQWHLINNSAPLFDVNIEGAWNSGITGSGVVIGIIDGGVSTSHPDLNDNYNSAASQSGGSSSHGSSCAGVAAAEGNNNLGVVGAAYDAEWAKLYYGGSSSNTAAFGYRNDLNDIKNNSWGPWDNGDLHTMTSAEYAALETSVTTGRQGLGTVYAWAAGNGGLNDRVEYDPYAASRYTLAIGAIGDQDVRSSYNEHGSSMTVVTQSNGNNRGITTTNSSSYTSSFGGTSSASPLGAGVVALMLEANPALTWRDVTAILIETARKNHPNDSDWTVNGAGHDVSIDYGFGAIDASAAVAAAQTWTNFTAEQSEASGVIAVNQTIPDNNATGLTRTWNSTQNIEIEAIEVVMNISHTYIGDIEVTVTSPSGTSSLLTKRRSDSQNHMDDYILTSLRCWDESSLGTWTVHVADRDPGTTGTWQDFEVKIYGHAPGAGPSMTLSAPSATAGQTLMVDLAGGSPSSDAYLTYSIVGTGSTFVPQLGVTLGLAQPVLAAGPVQTDAAGSASFSVGVPANAAGVSYWLQALQSSGVSSILPGVVQ